MSWWGDEFSLDRVFISKMLFDSWAPHQHIAGSIQDRSDCLFQHIKAYIIKKNTYCKGVELNLECLIVDHNLQA